jgi:hypothetical protein
MGDRSNIVVEQADGQRIFLYGHWMGADAINVVSQVLSRHERWGDESYLTRMLFSKMVEGNLDGDTGYGISTYQVDNDGYPLIIIKPASQTIMLERDRSFERRANEALTPEIGFDDFLSAVPEHANYDELAVNMGAKLSLA